MCLDFDEHHSGGSSFDLYIIFGFCYNMWAIPTGTNSVLKKKKSGKESSTWSRVPNSVRIRHSGRAGNRGVTDDAFFNRNWAGVCLGSLGRTRIGVRQVHRLCFVGQDVTATVLIGRPALDVALLCKKNEREGG